MNPKEKMPVGTRVKKRGFEHVGTVINRNGAWVSVWWDEGISPRERPLNCHVAELQEVD